MNARGPKILIVGAGPAGIAAATKLLLNGFQNVIILEAEHRIGGRIYTVDFAESKVDLGAQWVHGEVNNICYELASPYNLLSSSADLKNCNFDFVSATGEILPKETSRSILQIYLKINDELNDDVKPATTFGNYFIDRFQKEIQNIPNIPRNKSEEILRCIELFDASITACETWHEVSALKLNDYWVCRGDHNLNWKTTGYSKVLDILMKKYPNPEEQILPEDKILLGKSVKLIDYSSEDEVRVVTTNGSQFSADQVIVTVSLGVLKDQHETLFRPMLPFSKQRCIEGLGFGVVDKIMLEFPHRWWPENTGGFFLLWPLEEKQNFCKSFTEDQKWLCDVFMTIGVDFSPRIMSCWITGSSAKFMENSTNEKVLNDLHLLLKYVFRKTYDVPRPKKIIRSKWFTNSNFRGSYSFQSIISENLNISPRDLAEPIHTKQDKLLLLFAGEATHEHYFSTVHGAIESGYREAERIINYYRNKCFFKSVL